MTDRHESLCTRCGISQPVSNFQVKALAGHGNAKSDVRSAVCMECNTVARELREARLRRSMRGVNIDAIHYKLGAVKGKKAA